MGKSPAVLTEMVWALARQDPPLLPDEIIILTTLPGARLLREVLFEQNGWEALLQDLRNIGVPREMMPNFGPAQSFIRVLPSASGKDLEDLITISDHERAADFIMTALRAYTDDPGIRVIGSIAGGRKTMGAILSLCMSLLARKQDTLVHVLVNPPYDSPSLCPIFLFPKKGVTHLDPTTGKRYASLKARVELVEMPFVRMRGWLERKFLSFPSSYTELVRRMQGLVPDPERIPLIILDKGKGSILVGKILVMLSATEFAVISILLRRMKDGNLLQRWGEIDPELKNLMGEKDAPLNVVWIHDFQENSKSFNVEDARKAASRIRGKLKRAVGDSALVALILPSFKTAGLDTYPPAKIRIIDW